MIGISHTYPVGNSMLMLMTNYLPLSIYDLEFHKDPFLDLCHFCSILTICQKLQCPNLCGLFLYAGDTCLLFQHTDLEGISEELIKNVTNICGWSVDWTFALKRIKLNLSRLIRMAEIVVAVFDIFLKTKNID